MTPEAAFIAALRSLAPDPAARGLADDGAVVRIGQLNLVLTHDMIVEGVHFLKSDPPADIAWKLVAVNISDLAAKGAKPTGLLLGYSLADEAWNEAFIRGLGEAISAFGAPLLGGDTVSSGYRRTLGLTAIGSTQGPVPCRSGAKAGDLLWVSGSIGDAGAGLRIALGKLSGPETLLARYRRPQPRLELGLALAPFVHATMDVSDGLLIDAARMAGASGLGVEVALDAVPLSNALTRCAGDTRESRIAAATAGDDYELLFAAPPELSDRIAALSASLDLPITRIGRFSQGAGIKVAAAGEEIPLPVRLGYEHGA